MPFPISNNSSTTYEPKPKGNFVARCIQIIDLGTQKVEWQGNVKHQRKVMITWETPDERKEFKEGEGEKPFVFSKTYTQSMYEAGALRQDLESWTGGLSPEQVASFDLESMLDQPCMINVIHQTSKDGQKTYANVAGVTPLPKGVKCPEAENKIISFYLDEFNPSTFELLPEFIQNKIKESPEYQALKENGYESKTKQEVEGDSQVFNDEPVEGTQMPF